MTAKTQRTGPARARGFSLIELMIALLIGLLVVSAAGSLFISNKRTYNATETLGRIQENGRVAFELWLMTGTCCCQVVTAAASVRWGRIERRRGRVRVAR